MALDPLRRFLARGPLASHPHSHGLREWRLLLVTLGNKAARMVWDALVRAQDQKGEEEKEEGRRRKGRDIFHLRD